MNRVAGFPIRVREPAPLSPCGHYERARRARHQQFLDSLYELARGERPCQEWVIVLQKSLCSEQIQRVAGDKEETQTWTDLCELPGCSSPSGVYISRASIDNREIDLVSPRIRHGLERGSGLQNGVPASLAKDESENLPLYWIVFEYQDCGHLSPNCLSFFRPGYFSHTQISF